MPTGRFLLHTVSHQHVAVSLVLAQQQQQRHTELLPLALPVAAQARTREGTPARSLCLCCWAKSAGHADRAPGIRPAAPRAVPRGCLQSVLMGHSVAAPLPLCRAAGDRWSRANTLRTAGSQGSFTTPSIQRASQHPPHSGQPGKLHNTLHTAGFTKSSAQRATSQHPPHSGLHNTLPTREASQHPPHSKGSFTTPSAQWASQHPSHSERSFTTPSAQRASHTLRTAGFTTPSAQREKLHNTLPTAGFTTSSPQRASQHPLHSGLHTPSAQRALQHPPHSERSFTTPSAQRAATETLQHPSHSGQQGNFTTSSTQAAGGGVGWGITQQLPLWQQGGDYATGWSVA